MQKEFPSDHDLHAAPPDDAAPPYQPALTVISVPDVDPPMWHILLAGLYQATVGPMGADSEDEDWICSKCDVPTCVHIAVAQARAGEGR